MAIDTSASLGTVKAVLGSGAYPNVEIGVAPMPGPSGNGGVLVSGGALFMVNKSAPEKQAAAWQYLKYLDDTEQQAIWAAGTGYVPIRKSAAASKTMTDFWAANPLFKVAYDQLLAGADNPAGAGAVMGPAPAVNDIVRDAENSMFLQGVDPKTALKDAADQGRRRDQGLQHPHRRVARADHLPLLRRVADGLDVVAVGVADERAVVVRVVLGPHPRLVQHLGAGRDRGVEERAHRGPVGRDERDVRSRGSPRRSRAGRSRSRASAARRSR